MVQLVTPSGSPLPSADSEMSRRRQHVVAGLLGATSTNDASRVVTRTVRALPSSPFAQVPKATLRIELTQARMIHLCAIRKPVIPHLIEAGQQNVVGFGDLRLAFELMRDDSSRIMRPT